MGRVASFLFTFVILEVLWALLVGTTQSTELIVGLAAAAIAAAFAELLRSLGLFGFRTHGGLLAKAWKLPGLVLFDFALVTWVLIRALAARRRVEGEWTRVPFPTETGANGRWQRAFGVAMANGAANAVVVDLDADEALMHALEPAVFSARTVL